MNIGLTGGIAAGKSTVSKMLADLGAAIIDADVIAREMMEPGRPALEEVVSYFGTDIMMPDGSLNRKKLGSIVFNDPQQRKVLESITHPYIRTEIRNQILRYEKEDPNRLVVADIPLLYESGLEGQYEYIMVVYVPRDIQRKRLMKRDSLSYDEAEVRLQAQIDIELKKQRADIVIDNSQGIEETKRQVDHFWRKQVLL